MENLKLKLFNLIKEVSELVWIEEWISDWEVQVDNNNNISEEEYNNIFKKLENIFNEWGLNYKYSNYDDELRRCYFVDIDKINN